MNITASTPVPEQVVLKPARLTTSHPRLLNSRIISITQLWQFHVVDLLSTLHLCIMRWTLLRWYQGILPTKIETR